MVDTAVLVAALCKSGLCEKDEVTGELGKLLTPLCFERKLERERDGLKKFGGTASVFLLDEESCVE